MYCFICWFEYVTKSDGLKFNEDCTNINSLNVACPQCKIGKTCSVFEFLAQFVPFNIYNAVFNLTSFILRTDLTSCIKQEDPNNSNSVDVFGLILNPIVDSNLKSLS